MTTDVIPWLEELERRTATRSAVVAVCAVPQGGVGFDALLADVRERLPGFDNEAYISAMSCGDNRRFVVSERS
ncbi:MAG: hypothetical protein K8T90_07720 [Planctomycetes bacterium]|nr:hypothetical protein [Planctomycetota bacterium]